MGFGHIWACGQKSGRHCMKKLVQGAFLSHASWAMSSPAKERVRWEEESGEGGARGSCACCRVAH
eukprot:5579680-Pleurochrysis_carterae.AAC.1